MLSPQKLKRTRKREYPLLRVTSAVTSQRELKNFTIRFSSEAVSFAIGGPTFSKFPVHSVESLSQLSQREAVNAKSVKQPLIWITSLKSWVHINIQKKKAQLPAAQSAKTSNHR